MTFTNTSSRDVEELYYTTEHEWSVKTNADICVTAESVSTASLPVYLHPIGPSFRFLAVSSALDSTRNPFVCRDGEESGSDPGLIRTDGMWWAGRAQRSTRCEPTLWANQLLFCVPVLKRVTQTGNWTNDNNGASHRVCAGLPFLNDQFTPNITFLIICNCKVLFLTYICILK